jgi:hypothetical protein
MAAAADMAAAAAAAPAPAADLAGRYAMLPPQQMIWPSMR